MSFYAFRLLSPVVQLYWVLKHGTYLANRWEQGGGINPCHYADEGRDAGNAGLGRHKEQPIFKADAHTYTHIG